VAAAVQLDRQSRFVAVEVENIAAQRVLPPKLRARELPVAQKLPQQLLRIRRPLAKLAAALKQRWWQRRLLRSALFSVGRGEIGLPLPLGEGWGEGNPRQLALQVLGIPLAN
jgi:hypothetical protein